jgi:LysR family hydrogen peroxide-inducible transcriptional activator
MANITLRQLRYFQALAREGHFGRAADICAISQPALSLQIKELEETLGTPLFERGPRKVRLTSLGEVLAERARDILRAVDDLDDLARASREGMAGPLRIGVIPTVAPYLLPGIVSALAGRFPGLDIRIRESQTPRLIEELEDGRLDTAIVALPLSNPGLTEVKLFSEEFLLVRPGEERDKPVPPPEKLREMRLLLLEEGHCFREQALSFCGMDTTPRELMDGSSLTTLVQMVGAGIGVTLIPEMAMEIETRSAEVSVARFIGQKPSRTIGMVWRRKSPLAEQHAQIADIVRRYGCGAACRDDAA